MTDLHDKDSTVVEELCHVRMAGLQRILVRIEPPTVLGLNVCALRD